MKYGEKLKTLHEEEEAGHQYIQYTFLKTLLKEPANPDREVLFVRLVTNELERVKGIISLRVTDLRQETGSLALHTEQNLEEVDIGKLELLVDRLASNIANLHRFLYYNSEGFRKILKKHDKHWGKSSAWYTAQQHQTYFAEVESDLDTLLIRASDIYTHIRQQDRKYRPSPPNTVSQEVFERKSTKYWVSLQNVFQLKAQLIKYLPLHIFKRNLPATNGGTDKTQHERVLRSYESQRVIHDHLRRYAKSGTITSIYMDSTDHRCYLKRMNMEEGAELIRVRWYSEPESGLEGAGELRPPPQQVFMERKTHHESWVQATSVKERFTVAQADVQAFMTGTKPVDENLCRPASHTLAREIQQQVSASGMRPVVRTVYQRTAFQENDSNDVRVTLDTDLIFVDESTTDWPACGTWHRDEGVVAEADDWHIFDYAILEVKLKGPSPAWLEDLVNKDIVMQKHKFSKFQHGSAVYGGQTVPKFPYWFSEQQIDNALKRKQRGSDDDSDVSSVLHHIAGGDYRKLSGHGSSPASSQETVVTMPALGGDEMKRFSEPAVARAAARRNRSEKRYKMQKKNRKVKVATHRVKIEPKTFFANERTFIQWLSAALLIVTLSGALIGINTAQTRLIGYMFLPAATFLMLYAVTIFYWRLRAIKSHKRGRFDDPIGPFILVVFLVATLIVLVLSQYGIILVPEPEGLVRHPLVESSTCRRLPLTGLPPFIEPSDLALDAKDNDYVWTCSDSTLVKIYLPTGNVNFSITVPSDDSLDCEAVLIHPTDSDVMILGTEAPKNRLVFFHLPSLTILQELSVERLVDESGGWLEGIAFWSHIETTQKNSTLLANGSFFLTSGPNRIRSFLIEETSKKGKLEYRSLSKIKIDAKDINPTKLDDFKISALYVHQNHLYALQDNLYRLVVWDLLTGEKQIYPLPGDSPQWEGIVVRPHPNVVGSMEVVLSLDNPAQIWRFDFSLDSGFASCTY